MDREDLVSDPRFVNNAMRIENVDALDQCIGDWVIQYPLEHVLEVFDRMEVAGAPVNDISQIAVNEHFRARNLLLSVDDPDLGPTSTTHVHPRLSATPGGVRYLGGSIGRDNEDFYIGEFGLSKSQFEELRKLGAI